jgi:hypothetical protein
VGGIEVEVGYYPKTKTLKFKTPPADQPGDVPLNLKIDDNLYSIGYFRYTTGNNKLSGYFLILRWFC